MGNNDRLICPSHPRRNSALSMSLLVCFAFGDTLQGRLGDANQEKSIEKKAAEPTPPDPAAEKAPRPPAVPTNVLEARTLYEEGKQATDAKNWGSARDILKRCVAKDPANHECHKLLASAYASLKDAESGLKHYRLFLKLAPPDHPSIHAVKMIIEQYEASK